MKKKQIAAKIAERLIELDIEFAFSLEYPTNLQAKGQPLVLVSEDLGEIVITHGNVYLVEWDTDYPINQEEDLKQIDILWDEE